MSEAKAVTTTGPDRTVWNGRRIFLTGHTGFKGGWLSLWLAQLGATVRGYALDPYTTPNLLDAAKISTVIEDVRGDILDRSRLEASMTEFKPDIVIHMAAQPLVRLSYVDRSVRTPQTCAAPGTSSKPSARPPPFAPLSP